MLRHLFSHTYDPRQVGRVERVIGTAITGAAFFSATLLVLGYYAGIIQ